MVAEAGQTSGTITLDQGWNMVSFPVAEVTSMQPGSGVLASAFAWNAPTSSYQPVDLQDPASVSAGEGTGRGFWVYADQASEIQYAGWPNTGTHADPDVTLAAGWNLLGFPYGQAQAFSSVMVKAPGGITFQPLAVSASLTLPPPSESVLAYGAGFTYGGMAYETLDLSAPAGTFQAGKATWVYVYRADTRLRFASGSALARYAILCDGDIAVGDVTSLVPGTAHVRSNALGGNPNIQANSVDGPCYSREGAGSIMVAGAHGAEFYDSPAVTVPDLPIQDIVQSWSSTGIAGLHPYGGPATYIYNQSITATTDNIGLVYINNTRISPGSTVFVKGNLTFSGNATLATGIHFFVKGDVRANGSVTQVAASPAPPESPTGPPATGNQLYVGGTMSLNGLSARDLHLLTEAGLQQNGGSTSGGLLYARNGDVYTTGTTALRGILVARGGEVHGSGLTLTFDPSVADALDWLGLDLPAPLSARGPWPALGLDLHGPYSSKAER